MNDLHDRRGRFHKYAGTGNASEAQIRALAEQGLHMDQIAAALKVRRSMLASTCSVLGIKVKPRKPGKQIQQVGTKLPLLPPSFFGVRNG